MSAPQSQPTPITQTALAEKLGISQVTVHRALSGHPKVSPKTRKRILEAATKAGHRPNFFASHWKNKNCKLIALGVNYLHDPYSMDIVEAFEMAASARGYRIILVHLHNKTTLSHFHKEILDPSGVSLFALVGGASQRVDDATVQALAESGVNTLLIGRESSSPKVTQILTDNHLGGRLAADHCHSLDLRKLWVFTLDAPKSGIYQRAISFQERSVELGLPKPKLYGIRSSYNVDEIWEAIRETIQKVLSEGPLPDGIFCTGSEFAEVIRVLEARGVNLGQDLRLICYDDSWSARMACPELTTIKQPTQEMGTAGANLLIDIVEGKQAAGTVVRLEPSLILRKT